MATAIVLLRVGPHPGRRAQSNVCLSLSETAWCGCWRMWNWLSSFLPLSLSTTLVYLARATQLGTSIGNISLPVHLSPHSLTYMPLKQHKKTTNEIIIFALFHGLAYQHLPQSSKCFSQTVSRRDVNWSLPVPARTAYTMTPLSLTHNSFWPEHLWL